MLWAVLFLVVGLLLLWRGADFLVGGAVRLAGKMGISHLVVGMTIVAMGTSAPEVATSIAAAIGGKGDIAIGNICGSNIANLALIGGLVAMIRPLQLQMATLRREVPAMLAVALLLWPVLRDLMVSRTDAISLLVVFGVMVVYTVRTARAAGAGESVREPDGSSEASQTVKQDAFFVVLGLAALAIGARATVSGAVVIGARIGLTDAVIGSTIVAVGTSLPELMTCLVAAAKGHHDISVGNLVGSNIFNTLFVTGMAGLVQPFAVSGRFAGGIDYWIMVAVAVVFTAAAIIGGRTIRRSSGALLLGVYAAYLLYLFISAPGG